MVKSYALETQRTAHVSCTDVDICHTADLTALLLLLHLQSSQLIGNDQKLVVNVDAGGCHDDQVRLQCTQATL